MRKSARSPKVKKNILFLHFMNTFHHYALKIESSSAKRVANPISENRNGNDVSMYVWSIHSRIRSSKMMECKKA